MSRKPVIAVSACLVGQKVRHDGNAAELRLLTKEWSNHLDLLPICPEIEIGMEVPRPATILVKDDNKLKLFSQQNSIDYTEKMLEYSQIQSDYLAYGNLWLRFQERFSELWIRKCWGVQCRYFGKYVQWAGPICYRIHRV